jgi:carboxypeptidase T
MNLWTLFVSLAVLTEASASSLRKSPASKGLHSFPRVYTAVVPAPSNGTREDNANYFAAEVDLLKVIKLSDGEAKISFLVHDSEQLHRLQRLTQVLSSRVHLFQMDQNLTSDLHNQINYSDNTSRQRQRQSSYSIISDFPCYKDLQGTFDWMNDMVTRSYSIPGLTVTMTDIGDSYHKTEDSNTGYDMWALKITGEAADDAVQKGVFFAMSGIHAREYAPPELVSRWAELMVNSYGNDADITAMLDHTEIHIVLQSNPDGRHVAETNRDVMRRKNLNPTGSDAQCGDSFGVDLNRNFPFRWGIDSGSSGDVCAETYRGPAPASEPEVRAILAYCESIFPKAQRKSDPESQQQTAYDEESTIGVFVDIHSYGELIIWPW